MLHLRIIKFSIDMKRIFFFLIITIAFFSVNAQNLKPQKPAKAKKEEKPMDISDLDSKLSSILDDSDLNMKL